MPTINNKSLDLWLLRKEVEKMGGYLAVRIIILSEALYTGDAALLALGLWAHACLEAAVRAPCLFSIFWRLRVF